MGVYNCKSPELLRKSVQSICAQTYKDWEFIICDDGSTDNTLHLLQEIALSDSRIHVISYSQNKGLAHALNQCIAHSEGELIARQDDDDISLPERLQTQVEYMDMHPEYALVGMTAAVYDDSGIWGTFRVPEKPEAKSFLWTNAFLHPTVVMRREALLASGCYRVAKETSRCEDYDLFMRMYSMGYRGYNLQENLYLYRIVNDNRKYRTMRYRLEEAKVRYIGFKSLGLLPKGLPYVLKPILVGLIPQSIFRRIRHAQYD